MCLTMLTPPFAAPSAEWNVEAIYYLKKSN